MEWSKDLKGAKKIQVALAQKVKIIPLSKKIKLIAGVDAAFSEDEVFAVACLYKFPELILIEEACAKAEASFPYIPTFLSFREGPAIIKAIQKLKNKPDLILLDGQGIAHPKGLGIASHLGVLFDLPTIGCAKSKLVGKFKEPGRKKGSWSPLFYREKIVGAVLRTKDSVRPLFVSPGHRINLEKSLEIVLACVQKFRIPAPLRQAHSLSKHLQAV